MHIAARVDVTKREACVQMTYDNLTGSVLKRACVVVLVLYYLRF